MYCFIFNKMGSHKKKLINFIVWPPYIIGMLPSSWRNAWLHSSFCGVCSSKTILERVTKHHYIVCQMMSFILLFFFIILWGSSSTTLTRFANNTRLITMRSQPKCFEVVASLLLFQLCCEGLSYYSAYNLYLHYVDYCLLCVGRWLRYIVEVEAGLRLWQFPYLRLCRQCR